MKKILFVMPLMAISLIGCNKGGGDNPGPTYTITFNCTDCKAYDERDKEVTSVTVPAVDPTLSLYKEFHFEGNKPFKVPLKSNISIKKTGTDETVEYKYVNGTISVPIVGNLTVTAIGSSYSKDLETSSWDEIAEIAETGRADEFFKVGNTKAVRLKGQDFDHTVRIIDFNHDDLADGSGKAGITFEFADTIIGFKTYWNNKQKEDSTSYDFIYNSDLNDCLQPAKGEKPDGEIYKMMPSDLMSVIKTVNKTVDIHPNDIWEEGNYYTQLFPFSRDEIDSNSDSTYEYYKVDTVNRRIRSEDYWLRTPSTSASSAWNYRAIYVSTGGNFSDVAVFTYERAVAPAFCI